MRKYILNIRLSLLALFIFACYIPNAQAEQWVYRNPLDRVTIIRIQTNPNRFGIQDVLVKAKFCAKKSKYTCINSKVFKFAIPKFISKSRKSWTKNRITYDLVEIREINFFGIRDSVYIIDDRIKAEEIRFIYSRNRGLIGFGGYSKKYKNIFLIDSKCGFGAPMRCYTHK